MRTESHLRGWIALGNCIEGMSLLESGNYDLVFADPPFGIDFDRIGTEYRRDATKVVEGYREVEKSQYGRFTNSWVEQAFRMLRPGGTLWAVSGWTNSHIVHQAILDHGFELVNKVVWNYNFGVHTTKKFVTARYDMFYAVKPSRKKATFHRLLTDTKEDYHDRQSVWKIPRQYMPGQQKNSNKLPDALVSKIIKHTTNRDNNILDPFLGNGTTLLVGCDISRNVCGFEINPEAFENINRKIIDLNWCA